MEEGWRPTEAANREANTTERARVEAHLRSGDALSAGKGLAIDTLLDKEIPEPAKSGADEAGDENGAALIQ